MNTNLVKKASRSPEIIYYDVTNFYFEAEDPDEDILNEDGTVQRSSLRNLKAHQNRHPHFHVVTSRRYIQLKNIFPVFVQNSDVFLIISKLNFKKYLGNGCFRFPASGKLGLQHNHHIFQVFNQKTSY